LQFLSTTPERASLVSATFFEPSVSSQNPKRD
jgi:hypothetical protein